MAKFDWNEIVVTNDANIANGQVKDRMILVTGEKGDKGNDGRSIVDIKKTSSTSAYYVYTIYYTDGTKSTFTIDRPAEGSGSGNSDESRIYHFSVNAETGSDEEGNGSFSSPFKTLQRAIDSVPVGHIGTISLQSEGQYATLATTISNKIISIYLSADNIDIGSIIAGRSYISIDAYSYTFTVNSIQAEDSEIIIDGDNPVLNTRVIALDNTNFSIYGHTYFEGSAETKITANKMTQAYFSDIRFTGEVTVAIMAQTGSTVRYRFMYGDGIILNRGLCYTGGHIYRLTQGETPTFYVDGTNGSDSNTGLSINSPFKSLFEAIKYVPSDCYSIINLLNGDCGYCNITDKSVALNISGDDVVIGDLTLNRSNISINNQNKALTVGAIDATDSAMSIAASFTLTTDKEKGISLTGSRFYAKGSVTFEMTNNTVRQAIYATEASHAAFWRIHCLGTMTTAIYSSSGSIVGYASLDGDSTILHNEIKEYGGRIYSGIQDEGGNAAIAEEFDSTQNYQIGDYVVYDNNLYRFTTEHPAGNWNSNHVSKIHVADELVRLNEKVSKEPQDGKLYARRNDEWEEIVTTVDEPITTSTKDNIAYCFEGTKNDESAELVVELAPNNTKYLTNFLKHKMITYYASDGKNLIELYNKQNYDLPHTDTVGGMSVTTNPDGSFTLNGSTSIERELHIGYVKNCQGVNLRITGSVNSSQGFFHVYCEASTSGGSGGYDEGNGATFTGVTDKMPVWIHFSGEFQNATFYPMVRVASFGDDEFEEPITNNLEDAPVLDISSYDIYGGYVNFKTGTIVKTWGYIQSYNGEEITDEWISYGGGATPQTGEEVVYKLATPIEYHFEPLAIPTYNGKTTILLYCADEEDSQYRPDVVYIKNGVMLDDYAKQTKALIDKKADKLLVTRNFDATENYSVGDIVFYSDSDISKLYRFTVDHPAGDWNQSHAEETTIAEELDSKTSGKNIDSIVLSQSGAEYDTYRVTFSDETTLDFQIVKDTENFYTKQAVDNFLFNKADAIKEYGTRTVKGKEIYIPAGATVTDFKVYLEPFQSGEGEPSATNIQPVYETSEVEIQKKNVGGDWVHVDTLSAVKYVYNNQQTYGTIIDYLNRKSRSSWALIPNYTGESLPGRWVSDRDVYSDFAPTGQPSVGAQVAYEKATPESAEDLFRTDSEILYNFNQSEPYLLRAHYWHEYSQYDAEFVMELTYKADVPVDTKTYIDDKHDALREEMYSNLGTIIAENTSDTHWMKLENTRSNQVIKKLQIEYKPSLTSIDWIEVDIKNRNLIQTQFGYSGVTWKGVTFTQNEDDSISFTGTPTQDIDLDIGYVTGMPVGQYYISGGINTNCYIYILGASNIKSTGNDTLFTANQFIGSLPLELHITNTGEEVSGTFFPMVRFKDDDGTYIKPVYKASLWERLGTALDRKPAYGFSYDFVTATLTETWKHIDSYNFEPNPFPRRWIADDYTETSPYSGASVTYELVEPEVREEDNKYANQHLVDGVTYLFANNSNIVISEVIAEIRVDDFVEGLISGKADKTEVYTKTQTDDLISGKADKTEVYTKTQTDTLISNINNFAIHVCASGEYDNTTHLPTIANPEENTFYLVPTGTGADIFDEWIYVNNAWEKFGSSRIDLTSYYTKAETDNLIDTKANESVIAESFDATKNYQIGNFVIDDHKLYKITQAITSNLERVVLKSTTSSANLPLGSHFTFDGKLYETMVDNFSFEYNILTEEDLARYISENKVYRIITTEYAPGGNYSSGRYVTYNGKFYTVKSSGIYTGFDSSFAEEVIVANEINSIETNLSNFYTKTETNTLLNVKQDTLTFDTAPTANSTNPVTSGGLKTVIDKKANLASPSFTGTPKAPTPTAGNNTTQIATTAFVKTAVDNKTTSWGEVSGVLSDQADLQDVLNLKADITTTYTKTETDAIFEEKANESIIAEEWSNIKQYSAGDIVLHNHELYKFNSGFSPNVEQIIIKNTVNKYTYEKDDLFLAYNPEANVYRYVSDSVSNVASAPIQSKVLSQWLANGTVVVVNTPDYTQGNTYEIDDIVKVGDNYYIVTVAGSYVEWNPAIVTKITVIGSFGTMAKFDDAPNDGNMYVRQNGQWAQLNLS